ncbi:hypothetical protein SEA_ESKETIT_46 [Streptomyces phage Esketit]|uniref:Lipoprotein n=6 Tax=Rimavirus rima TaxID=2560784 RepID=A0A515MIS6_9CAUD|nr:hypothetical protein SEA_OLYMPICHELADO_46 [Streptomyces phage OlympicHelado]ASU04041.1 hypothetical protein SEA_SPECTROPATRONM_46 [Streptomyces phage Spectropatronm]QDM56547.1 hypothetical protein SEA_ESKETIT_46 [Streptomyces phage Esketit]QEQ93825.1 hypothetical protein SEA_CHERRYBLOSSOM_46 [Streptomyces phage CherryBlossom]QEQ94262.1 hypothetical protein SEA_HOSHI_45 [Streptomyces phage Hoshi]QWY81445.1 hypothetical protein PET_TAIDAONE_46 [Streptomyces phage TaidaOne]UOW93194.1 lipoprot
MRRSMIISVAALTSISLLTACGTETGSKAPKSFVGDWYQTNGKDTGVYMTAAVSSNDTIQIHLKTRDSGGVYWMGSFQVSDKKTSDSFKLESKADPDAQKWMASSIFGSQDKSKSFKYENGDLSYEFTMVGVTKTIHLSKAESIPSDENAAAPEVDIDIHKPKKVKTPKPASPPKAPPAIKSPVKK